MKKKNENWFNREAFSNSSILNCYFTVSLNKNFLTLEAQNNLEDSNIKILFDSRQQDLVKSMLFLITVIAFNCIQIIDHLICLSLINGSSVFLR